MHDSRRSPARDAAISRPTDWAAVGARVLDVATQAAAIHMSEVARLKAEATWRDQEDAG